MSGKHSDASPDPAARRPAASSVTPSSPQKADWRDPERFRLIVECVADYAIFMLDPTGHITTWNRGAERIKQYQASEIIGKHFSIFYPQEALDRRLPEHELEVATAVGRYEEEGWRVRKDGTLFWANVVITAVRDETGTLRGFAKVTRDLTERRKAEDELRRSEQRMRLLIESIHDYAIFMLDADGHVVTWNRGAQRIKGYTPEEIIGKHFSVFYPPGEAESGRSDRELHVAAAQGRFEEESWRVRKDGTQFWANVVITAIRDETGKLVGFAKVTRDLTERRKADEQRLKLAHAEEALRLRDEFLSIASHELRTPLTSIQLQVSGLQRLLGKGVPGPAELAKLSSRSATLDHELERMARLINDLLDVSRAAAGRLHIERAPTDLSSVVRSVAARMGEDLAAAGCTLTLDVADGLVADSDATRVDQVLTNFVGNAIKYGAGKPIEVRLARRGDVAELSVRDHGIGISVEDQERIFDRFARAVPATHYGGLGLGLWIVRLIVEALGGTVSVESEPGAGATLTARMPLAGSPGASTSSHEPSGRP